MSTGVRILPRDTIGYMFDGVMGSYQMVRRCQEFLAKKHPERVAEIRSDALALNRTHLRRLLENAVQAKHGTAARIALDHWLVENLPRADRSRINSGIRPSKRRRFYASHEYLRAVEQAHQRGMPDILRGFGRPKDKA